MKQTKKVFRSRISVLLSVFILVIFILPSIPIIQEKIYLAMYGIGGTLLFIVLLFTGIRYVISDYKLISRVGFLSFGSVNITDIISVERSYNPLSSPAASIKRLRISLRKGVSPSYMLISPVKEQEFIEELKKINPNIYVRVPEKTGIWRIWDWDF
jgi:hypothetical protein